MGRNNADFKYASLGEFILGKPNTNRTPSQQLADKRDAEFVGSRVNKGIEERYDQGKATTITSGNKVASWE
jgi:hypothetical protein